MNRSIAISLLALFVFNSVGYRLLIAYMNDKADIEFASGLDKGDYYEDDLIAVKIPAKLPYQNDAKGYERVDGEITVDGRVYKFVKRKFYNDTLTLLFIRDDKKTALQQKGYDHLETTASTSSSGNDDNKKAGLIKQLFSDLYINSFVRTAHMLTSAPVFNLERYAYLPTHYIPIQVKPPDPTV